MTCSAKQFSDQMVCKPCDLTWDVNDPDPPKCKVSPLKPTLDAEVLEVIMTLVADLKLKPGRHEFKLSFELMDVVNGYDIFDQALVKVKAKP